MFCDIADGFAGLGSTVTEMLQESYGSRGILTWGLAPVSHPGSVSNSLTDQVTLFENVLITADF